VGFVSTVATKCQRMTEYYRYIDCITNKVRLCEQSEPQSEPFVGQARSPYIENSFFGGRPSDQMYVGQDRFFFRKIDL